MNEHWNGANEDVNDEALARLEAEMAGDLHSLRTAATVYAERINVRTGVAGLTSAGQRRSVWAGARLGWAGAALAAVALTVAGGVRMVHHGSVSAPGVTTASETGASTTAVQGHDAGAVSDEALLDQIQSDLSTGVPAAMQPLASNNGQRSSAASQSRTE